VEHIREVLVLQALVLAAQAEVLLVMVLQVQLEMLRAVLDGVEEVAVMEGVVAVLEEKALPMVGITEVVAVVLGEVVRALWVAQVVA
jgi:hypothetical protein